MSPRSEALLRVEGLTVGFGDQYDASFAVKNLDLTVGRGESVGLVGESGSGKTMAIRAILGLLPRHARRSCVSIWFDGVELSSLRPGDLERIRGSAIGFIPQDPLAALNPVLSVGDQITEPVRLHDEGRSRLRRGVEELLRGYGIPLERRQYLTRAGEMLERVGIRHPNVRAKQYPHQFSGGMRQRAIIASALALQPKLVIADEPTTALDATIEAQILGLLRELRAQGHMALLLVSHDLNVVSWNCDYAYVLYAGRPMEEGAVAELFQQPRHPYTASLIAASPDLDKPPSRARVERLAPRSRTSEGCPFAPRCENALDACWKAFPLMSSTRSGVTTPCDRPRQSQTDRVA
jgi:oligopeptide/dipeptide ABC transporter ATP-binding protein